jgi:hypothetical protein
MNMMIIELKAGFRGGIRSLIWRVITNDGDFFLFQREIHISETQVTKKWLI